MRALVTGAGGFLGSYICRRLQARGVEVVGLGRNHYPLLDTLGITQIRADVRDAALLRSACQRVDVVFHTAAIAGIWGPRKTYESVNVQGTLNVIRACQAQDVRRLVYTSTPSVTFTGADQCGVDESVPYARRWLCEYARTKAHAEQAVLRANSQQLLTCALRPHLIWGPGDPHLIPRLIQRAAAGRLRRVGDGTNRIDITYIDNAAEAHVRAAEALTAGSAVAGRAYFISQGEPVNCWDWIGQILRIRGLELPVKRLSLNQAWALGWTCEAVYRLLGRRSEPPMTRFLAAQLARSHYFKIDRAQADFGYRPEVDQEEGFRRLAKWLTSS